ncbi:MAG: alpha/beta hydrolase [Bacteroidales bacterium]|nr:alpha/beta hydrolase [Bacteroidales bacterium]
MRRLILTHLIILLSLTALGQSLNTIYFLPGQGSDERIFDSLNFDPSFKLEHIKYPTPEKGTNLKQYAKIISTQIDTGENFILVGVSFGGMISSELIEILNPEKVLIISSAKNRTELPFRYKFQKSIPLYKIMPGKVLLFGAKLLQPIVEPDRDYDKETFKSMLGDKDPKYMKRTIDMIITWERMSNSDNIVHIHGDNDHTLPIRKVNPNYIIPQGSHMMTLTRAEEISQILNKEIEGMKE